MTRKEAIKISLDLWKWLHENPGKEKKNIQIMVIFVILHMTVHFVHYIMKHILRVFVIKNVLCLVKPVGMEEKILMKL